MSGPDPTDRQTDSQLIFDTRTDRQASDRKGNNCLTDSTVQAQANSQSEVPWRLP